MKYRSVMLVGLGVLSLVVAMMASIAQSAARDVLCYETAKATVNLLNSNDAAFRNCSTPSTSQNIIGITKLDPRTQQLKIGFSTKTNASHGATISLDFASTVTSYRLGVVDNGVATNFVQSAGIYIHPQMSAERIMGRIGSAAMNMKGTTTTKVVNAPTFTGATDFRLTPTVFVGSITRDVYIGFVPASSTYPVTNVTSSGDSGFYGAGWSKLNTAFPVWDIGMLSYRIASDCLDSVEVVSLVAADPLLSFDSFEQLCDSDLDELLKELVIYFRNNPNSIRMFLEK